MKSIMKWTISLCPDTNGMKMEDFMYEREE